MITLYQANKIYELVRNEYFSLLNNELLFISEGTRFCFFKNIIGCDIHIKSEFNNKKEQEVVRLITNKGLQNEFKMMEGINEVIAFLHEVGHFYDFVLHGFINDEGYKEFKEKSFFSINQANKDYRSIPAENFADMFAVNFINKHGRKIWKIMNPDFSYGEIDEWIEMFK